MADRKALEAIPDLGAPVERAAALWSDAPCLHFDETGETVGFAEVEARTAAIAR